jgi:hypothetical protein
MLNVVFLAGILFVVVNRSVSSYRGIPTVLQSKKLF